MNIIYMGTPDFAVAPLEKLVEAGFNITAVVTVPDKPAGRGRKLQESAVKLAAQKLGLPILQPEKLRSEEFAQELEALEPDIIMVTAFKILSQRVLDIPKIGCINLHASLLPKYRGAAPINWAIIRGEQKTGVSTFFLQPKVDTGDVLMQAETEIGPNETVGELYHRLMHIGANLVVSTMQAIQDGTHQAIPQEEPKDDFYAKKIFKEDCEINPNLTVQEVHNFIRGLSPYPAAWILFQEKSMKVFKAEPVVEQHQKEVGSFEIQKSELLLYCSNGYLKLKDVQLQGKKRMPIQAFLNGIR